MQFHRHVTKTGEIKDFVITEESGIAKGIRRIIGVTGNEAKEVRRLGDALKAKLGVKGGGRGVRWSGKWTGVWKEAKENTLVEEILQSLL